MTEQEKKVLLDFFNSNDELDILDPDGICSFIKFQSATQTEDEEGVYFKFEVLLDPNQEEFEDVFYYYPKTKTILEKQGVLAPSFIQEFETNFITWIKGSYYDVD